MQTKGSQAPRVIIHIKTSNLVTNEVIEVFKEANSTYMQ